MSVDIHILQTTYGGEVTKDLATRDGLESAVYLSLFGGNVGDDGMAKCARQWWGNLKTREPERHYRGEAANLLNEIPPTAYNLRRVEDAAARDLAWMKAGGYARSVKVSARLSAPREVSITVAIDDLDPLRFATNWGPVTYDDLVRQIEPPVVIVNGPHTLTGSSEKYCQVYFVRQNGEQVWAEMDKYGNWIYNPYPLASREVVLAYATTGTGLTSAPRRIVGGTPLLFDGSWKYDGSQEYDGVKNDE